MKRGVYRLVLLAGVALAGCQHSELQPDVPTCSTPRDAADSLLAWQHPRSYDLDHATRCMEAPDKERARLAVHLKQVLDGRGLYVPVSSLSDEPDWTNEEGEHQVTPLGDEFPLLIKRLDDGRWVYAKETLSQVDALYQATFSSLALAFQSWMPQAMFGRLGGLYYWQLLMTLLLVGLSVLAGRLVGGLVRGQVARYIERRNVPLDQQLFLRTRAPLTALTTLLLLRAGLPNLQLPVRLTAALQSVLEVATIITATWVGLRFVGLARRTATSIAERTETRWDDQLVPLLGQALHYLTILLGGLFVLDALGVEVWKLAAGVGIGGLAFALAAKDTVANVFGSINIFLDQPFQIGDWIKVGDVEGVVEEVGFRSTRVRTFYNSLITIPNSLLTNAEVDNMGARHRRRIKLTLGLTYDTPVDKVQAFVEGVRAILAAHPMVEKTYEVHFHGMGASSLDILVYYHVVSSDWSGELQTRGQNLLEFMRLADALGVSFAFPSTSVYLESTPDKPLPEHPEAGLEELQRIYAGFGPEGDRARPDGPAFPTA